MLLAPSSFSSCSPFSHCSIKDLWNPTIKAWFGDLGDGKHTGDIEDPRVGVIRVVPDEIRLWVKRESSIRQAFEVAKGAVTGETASPGDLLIISASDVSDKHQMFYGTLRSDS